MKVHFILNGKAVEAEGRPTDRLLDVLRHVFHLTGAKEGCGEGECGACTVLLDGRTVLSCLVPLIQVDGRSVITVEGLAATEKGHAYLERFALKGGTQCGACTPGIVLSGAHLLQEHPHPSHREVAHALAGNICRCTGYQAIQRALSEEPEAVLDSTLLPAADAEREDGS